MGLLPRDSGPGYLPENWHRLVRLLGTALLVFCLLVVVLAWWRDVPLTRYLAPLAVAVGGFVALGGLTVAGWRLIDRL